MKERKIDFVLEESENERLIFRFYSRSSYCHIFNDDVPKSCEDVCKVYFYYSIIKQFKCNNNNFWRSDTVYEENCDESSILDKIGCRLVNYISKGNETLKNDDEEFSLINSEVYSFEIGTSWTINKCEHINLYENKHDYFYYEFILWSHNNCGFRFRLKEDKIEAFGNYLVDCCKYMLERRC